jgi:hypothetical protein
MREAAVCRFQAVPGDQAEPFRYWVVADANLAASRCCVRDPTPPIKIERTSLFKRRGQQGNVYQAHQHGKWNPRSSAYGRFWIDIPDGERERRTVSLGLCATQWVARLRLREHIERAGVSSRHISPNPNSRYYISAAGRMVDGVSLYA